MPRIFLIGMPGAGKTTLGSKVAKKLGMPFLDLDALIEKEYNRSIEDIFSNEGEEHFRTLESDQLQKTIRHHDDLVLACGGGTPCFHGNMALMNDVGVTVYIDCTIQELDRRLRHEAHRPLLKSGNLEARLEKLLTSRKGFYEQARITVTEDEGWEGLIESLQSFRS